MSNIGGIIYHTAPAARDLTGAEFAKFMERKLKVLVDEVPVGELPNFAFVIRVQGCEMDTCKVCKRLDRDRYDGPCNICSVAGNGVDNYFTPQETATAPSTLHAAADTLTERGKQYDSPGGKRSQPIRHGHYFRKSPYKQLDFYRIAVLFAVTDPCLQHVLKKALVAGNRGYKDIEHDVQDMIDTLKRWQDMRTEETECAV